VIQSTFFEENFIKSIEEGEDLDEEQSFSRDPSSSKKAPAPKGTCTAHNDVLSACVILFAGLGVEVEFESWWCFICLRSV
jgi:hypothetical protein